MDQESPRWLKPARCFILLSVVGYFLAMAQLSAFMVVHCEVMHRVMFGYGTPYPYLSLFPGWRWIAGVVLFAVAVGGYAIWMNRHVLFSFVCCAMFLTACYNLVYSYYQSVSYLDFQMDRYNQHQSEWTLTYAAKERGVPEGSPVVLEGYQRPGILPEMWRSFRRSRGLPEDAPPRKAFEPPSESSTEPGPKGAIQEKNSETPVQSSVP